MLMKTYISILIVLSSFFDLKLIILDYCITFIPLNIIII